MKKLLELKQTNFLRIFPLIFGANEFFSSVNFTAYGERTFRVNYSLENSHNVNNDLANVCTALWQPCTVH